MSLYNLVIPTLKYEKLRHYSFQIFLKSHGFVEYFNISYKVVVSIINYNKLCLPIKNF